ncbi:MAG: DUF488 family protein [Microbacteriaceae bacterium]
MSYQVKRVYENPSSSDGFRVLVDRLWPRGLSKERAHLDEWLKEVAPTNELRTWFGHEPAKFAEFCTRYDAELDANPAVATLRSWAAEHELVTLLYSAHDQEANQAVALLAYLGDAR